MNLNTVQDVRSAHRPGEGVVSWRDGDAWLAGGTWLFSEPQPHLRRLLDLDAFGWPALVVGEQGLRIAATCTIAELDAFVAPADWVAAPLIRQCCRALLASFKVWHLATVGGNICMSLPAGAMTSLAVALEADYTIWTRDGGERRIAAKEFVTGDGRNVLQPGDLLRAIDLPLTALRKRAAFRSLSLTHLGRSTALLVGTVGRDDGGFGLTVSASTKHPVRLDFARVPDAHELRQRLGETISDAIYHDDVHGAPDYRKHLTFYFAEAIRAELSASPVA